MIFLLPGKVWPALYWNILYDSKITTDSIHIWTPYCLQFEVELIWCWPDLHGSGWLNHPDIDDIVVMLLVLIYYVWPFLIHSSFQQYVAFSLLLMILCKECQDNLTNFGNVVRYLFEVRNVQIKLKTYMERKSNKVRHGTDLASFSHCCI